MAQIKVIYKNADGYDQEHSEAADTIKFASFKTANYDLTDVALGHLIGGGDAADFVHNHDGLYFRESEHIAATAGAADAAKPVKTDAGGKLDSSFIDVPGLSALISHGDLADLGSDDHTIYILESGARDFSGVVKYASHPAFDTDTQLVDKKYVDDQVAGLESQSVLDIITALPGSPATGDKYLVASTGTSGALIGQENKIATWNGTAWTSLAPTVGLHVYVDDEPSNIYLWGGTSYSVKTYETTTASTGLVKVGSDIRLDASAAGAALGFTTGVLDVQVAAAGGLEIATDELQIKADGVKDTMIDFGTGAGQVSAADIPLADAGSYFTTDNVESALQSLAASVLAQGVEYIVGVGGVTKGDPVYVSDFDTVSKYGALSNSARIVGLALDTVAAAGTVKVLANDTVCPAILTGAAAGASYYWSGTALSTSIPSGGGSHAWKLGTAKNATDLHVEVEFIKKNA